MPMQSLRDNTHQRIIVNININININENRPNIWPLAKASQEATHETLFLNHIL